MDSHSSPSWREHANPALRTIWANFRCSELRGGFLGLDDDDDAAALLLLLERVLDDGGGEDGCC